MRFHIVGSTQEGLKILQILHRGPLTNGLAHSRVGPPALSANHLSNQLNYPLSKLELLNAETEGKS